ncbi:hypothetical protein CLOM_g2714 [Closterium sp. NIES-68]|nr:hypothetical protein CLOM_g2714 [Closterium sp. NIES-68]GJP79703.1 hypothetical protein CLOP_g9898 [Closterium sp. NIES-67]
MAPSMAGMNAAHGDELPRQRRKRRTKAQMAADRAIAAAFKRKRGRPSKSDVLARQALIMAAHSGMPVTDPSNIDAILAAQNASALVPTATATRARMTKSQLKARRLNQGAGDDGAAVQPGWVGQNVQGVLDGTFDAGYFVTIRVGNTNTILRGVVFAPGVAAPLPWPEDAAPRVLKLKRDPSVALPAAGDAGDAADAGDAPAAVAAAPAAAATGGGAGGLAERPAAPAAESPPAAEPAATAGAAGRAAAGMAGADAAAPGKLSLTESSAAVVAPSNTGAGAAAAPHRAGEADKAEGGPEVKGEGGSVWEVVI